MEMGEEKQMKLSVEDGEGVRERELGEEAVLRRWVLGVDFAFRSDPFSHPSIDWSWTHDGCYRCRMRSGAENLVGLMGLTG